MLIPAFNDEIDWGRGTDKTQEGKDYCRYVFKNKSWFDNIAAKDSTRGKRRHGLTSSMPLVQSFLFKIFFFLIKIIKRRIIR